MLKTNRPNEWPGSGGWRLAIFAVIAWGITFGAVSLAVVAMVGCSSGPVYEYRVIEETENGFRVYSGDEPPVIEDGGYVVLATSEPWNKRFVPVADVEIKRVQIGPHQCDCGTILRTYRDRCHKCKRMILLGCRTPPSTEAHE